MRVRVDQKVVVNARLADAASTAERRRSTAQSADGWRKRRLDEKSTLNPITSFSILPRRTRRRIQSSRSYSAFSVVEDRACCGRILGEKSRCPTVGNGEQLTRNDDTS